MLKGRRLAIGVDVRRGVRRIDAAQAEADVAPAPEMTTPAVVIPSDDGRDRYTRARIMALVTF